MSVKSIKFKLMIGGPQYVDVRRGLYKTHEVFNQGVRYYQEWLLLMRQDDVFRYCDDGPEIVLSAADCKKELIQRLRQVQMENTGQASHSDNELLHVMRALYELIVPSAVGKRGDAASLSRKFLSPLAWKDSKGLTGESKAGNKPRWKRLMEQGLPYEEEYEKWRRDKEVDPAKCIPEQLKALGLKPFLKVFTESTEGIQWFPLAKDQGVRTWDRDMFQQAIEGLLSWESWNRRVQEECQQLNARVAEYHSKYFADQPAWADVLGQVEEEMKAASLGFESRDPFAHRITGRAIRGWDRIADAWRRLPTDAPESEYFEAFKQVQRKNPRKIGSPPLFERLAATAVRDELLKDPQVLVRFAEYNELLKQRAQAKQFAQKTLPDPIHHPVWMRYDKIRGNLHHYQIIPALHPGDRHQVNFSSLLLPAEDGTFVETANVTLPLAPSWQFPSGVINPEASATLRTGVVTVMDPASNVPAIYYRDRGCPQLVPVVFGGAKIQFHRERLKAGQRKGVLGAGGVGSAYINVTLDVALPSERDVSKVFSFARDGDSVWLKSTELDQFMHLKPVNAPGVRVMSVDLGVRYGATISVFEVKQRSQLQEFKLHYPIAGCADLVAVHERSVILKLPGERKRPTQEQVEMKQAISALRSEMGILRRLLQISQAPAEKRLQELKELMERRREHNDAEGVAMNKKGMSDSQSLQQFQFEVRNALLELERQVSQPQEVWETVVLRYHRNLEHIVASHIRAFQSLRREPGQAKKKGGGRLGGLSLTHIDILTNYRKTLIRWSTHARTYADVRRLPKGQVFAKSLQNHINHVKEDRIKKLADMIVMTARGYRFLDREARWIQTGHAPCDLILFEDLSRYQFKTDRPPSENNQLMKWSHRELLNTVKMQATVFGIGVGTVPPAYTSRFDAETGAPGLRCKSLTAADKENPPFWLKQFAEEIGVKIADMDDGQLIPVDGGEWFVSPRGPKARYGLKRVHADVNAAHNLQRRLWSSPVVRVRCRRYAQDDGVIAIPIPPSFAKAYGKGAFVSSDGETYEYQVGRKVTVRRTDVADEKLEEDFDTMAESFVQTKGSGDSVQLFFDESRYIGCGKWMEAKTFWGKVRSIVQRALRDQMVEKNGADSTAQMVSSEGYGMTDCSV
ncbi:MAG: type V CRISPR-associated protein Cas12b [Firmicutes bacterium]|nr:type V CRISPR-associated protein Cas12b [Bacillota bacterium]